MRSRAAVCWGPTSRVDCLQLISCLGGCSAGQNTSCCRSWHYYMTAYIQWVVNSLVGMFLKCLQPCPIWFLYGLKWALIKAWFTEMYKWVHKNVLEWFCQISHLDLWSCFCCFIFSGLYSRSVQFAHQVLCGYEYSAFEKLPRQGLSRSVL